MERFDAVVVGAGPAGTACAYELAKGGAKVLLLEKKKLPRFKLCGGALSYRFAEKLPFEPSAPLHPVKGGYLGYGGEYAEEEEEKPVALVTERSAFDRSLALKAAEAGATLREGEEFLSFEEEGETLRVYTSFGEVRASLLVGADGFYSKVARALGYERRKFYRSVELELEGEGDEEKVVIELGLVRRGYGWIFPRGGGRFVAGVASAGRENLKEVLESWLRRTPLLKVKKKSPLRGWFIPFAEKDSELLRGRGRVLLAGDAGNFVDPLLGEGIYYAWESGRALALSFLEDPSSPLSLYAKKTAPLGREFFYAGLMAKLAYRFQKTAFSMGKKLYLRYYLQLLRGELTYERLFKRGLPDFLKDLLFSYLRR